MAAGNPWELPGEVFDRRARKQADAPGGPSFEAAREAIARDGEVLDVGAGAGAASIGLPKHTKIIAVDESQPMLDRYKKMRKIQTVHGRWPDVGGQVPEVDVVLCHHVLYNVPDLGPFIDELTAHARRRVVVEVTAVHPMVALNDLWSAIHGVQRPTGPSAEDIMGIIEALGYLTDIIRWTRPAEVGFESRESRLRHTAQRLCLPPERIHELEPLIDTPPRERRLVTITWERG